MASVARITEISAISDTGFDDAVRIGIARASQTLRGLRSAWVKEQEVLIGANGTVSGWKVNLSVTFVLDDKGGFDDLEPYLNPATQTADLHAVEE